jgi:predicted NUDIX family NTP pyrophosphohydrolase
VKVSAGVVAYRIRDGRVEVLIAHPGGPFFSGKDAGHWTIPKGVPEPGEDHLTAARREFGEETGFPLTGFTDSDFHDLGTVKQQGGKVVHAFACPAEVDPAALVSNTFRMEWPPRSGKQRDFPEVDEVRYVGLDEARMKLIGAQAGFIDRLAAILSR